MSSRIRRATFAVALVNLICVCSAFAQESAAPRNPCAPGAAPFAASPSQSQWNGWGNDSTQRRFQTAERAGLRSGRRARVEAEVGVRLSGRLDGVRAADRRRHSASSWAARTARCTRSARTPGASTGRSRPAHPCGRRSASARPPMRGRSISATSRRTRTRSTRPPGKLLWKTRVDAHAGARITGAPTLADGRLYVPASSTEEGLAADPTYPCCSFRGSVSALDAATGAVMWKTYTIPEEPKPIRKNKLGVQLTGPSGAAVWSSPTVDLERGMVFVTTGDNYSDPATATSDAFVAFDVKTGKLLWSRQMTAGDAFTVDCDFPDQVKANCPTANGPDHDFGSSPVLVTLGERPSRPDCRSEVGHRARGRPGSAGRDPLATPDRQGRAPRRHSVGHRRRRRQRLCGRLGCADHGSAARRRRRAAVGVRRAVDAESQGGRRAVRAESENRRRSCGTRRILDAATRPDAARLSRQPRR